MMNNIGTWDSPCSVTYHYLFIYILLLTAARKGTSSAAVL